MKNVLIIYPHWVPSNLVGVQRARLIANFLVDLGWQPIILAVRPEYYEEPLSPELVKTVSPNVRVEWVDARPVKAGNRLIGDIAIRAYHQLIDGAVSIIRKEPIDFIWSPIPSFYTALIARKVHDKTGIQYGLDYMDPWVHDFRGSNRLLSKGWMAKQVAKILEPIAVKKASLLTGVSELSYLPVIERNKHLSKVTRGAMPLGFDPADYDVMPDNLALLWGSGEDILPVVYAGAFLPKSHYYIQTLFRAVKSLRDQSLWNDRIRFYFVGTGRSDLKTVKEYAIEYGIEDLVFENTNRISYLEVLNNLSKAYGVLAIGNTEAHYTASKIFQVLLSKRPVFAMFHQQSSVIEILRETQANQFLVEYDEDTTADCFDRKVESCLIDFISGQNTWKPDLSALDKYSAKASASALVVLMEKAGALGASALK